MCSSNAITERKIFAIGLNKTGTNSLGHALNLLGVKTLSFPSDSRVLEQLRQGELPDFGHCQAVTDLPLAIYYPQLDKLYPGSKFILTVRDKKSWLKSIGKCWESMLDYCEYDQHFREFTHFISAAVYGTIHFNQQRFSYVCDQHIHAVKRYFESRADDLLVLDICGGEGWEKLCPFLGIAEPDKPFPRLSRYDKPQEQYRSHDRVDLILRDLRKVVISDETLILVDQDQFAGSEIYTNYSVFPFPERSGKYSGPPENSRTAIKELERLRRAGAKYIAFGWPTFWWLGHYTELDDYLRQQYQCVLENDRVVVFNLDSHFDPIAFMQKAYSQDDLTHAGV